jgi:hypothetical protein
MRIGKATDQAKGNGRCPVYILSGLFADLLCTPYGPGGFDTSGERPRMRYSGNGDTNSKWPWSTQDDAAA